MKLFSRHYGTERFFIMIAVCFALLVGLSTYGGIIEHQNNRQRISSTAIYNRNYVWSRTGSQGEVVGMFTDTSRSAMFVLLRNDAATTSTSAQAYQVFMKGRDEALENKPVLTVFVYGPTGYVGLYFKDTAGFKNQVYSLIVRNDSAASEHANEGTFTNVERDQSFIDHNQIRLYLNFGASEVPVAPVMDLPNVTPLQLFMDMPASVSGGESAAAKYASACGDAQAVLAEMVQTYILINQGRENLQENGVVVPDLPHYIANDRIDTVPNDFSTEPMAFVPEMVTTTGTASGVESLYDYDMGSVLADGTDADANANADDGSGQVQGVAGQGATYTDKNGDVQKYYYLHTDYLFPGMVSFEWQGKAFSSGFIDRIGMFTGDGTSSTAWYNTYAAWRESSKSEYANAMSSTVKYDSWRYADGSIVDMTKATGNSSGGIEAIVPNLCRDYTNAVNKYMQLKTRYGEKMAQILDVENSVQALAGIMSSNDGKAVKNLWLY